MTACDVCTQPAKYACRGCRQAVYCGQECQRSHWKTHSLTCKNATQAPFDPLSPTPPTFATVGDGVEIRESQIRNGGVGLFATRRFESDEAVTAYTGRLLKYAAARELPKSLATHMRAHMRMRWVLDGRYLPSGILITDPATQLQGLGGAAFANDVRGSSLQVNTEFDRWDSVRNRWRVSQGQLDDLDPAESITFLRALRTIEPGEEIFVDYGMDYWRK